MTSVSARLALSIQALGAAGEAWLAGLPGLLASVEADWSVTVGVRLDGGGTAYVAEAVTHNGTPGVVKVSIPPGVDGFNPFERATPVPGGDPELPARRPADRDRPPATSVIRRAAVASSASTTVGRPNRSNHGQDQRLCPETSVKLRSLATRGEPDPDRDLRPGADAELRADVLDVRVDGPHRHAESLGDLGLDSPSAMRYATWNSRAVSGPPVVVAAFGAVWSRRHDRSVAAAASAPSA
jgi:hypothetical protein